MRRRTGPLFAWLLLTAFAAPSPLLADPAIEGALAQIAALPSRSVAFVEEKRLSSLTVPLISRGRLVFVRPSLLEKDTVTPRPERLVIDGDQLTIATPGAPPRTVTLDGHPALRLLADTLRAVLGGDLATLHRLYAIDEQGSQAAWRLLMVPREASLRAALARVTVDGAGADIRQIDIQQANGDEQRLAIHPTP